MKWHLESVKCIWEAWLIQILMIMQERFDKNLNSFILQKGVLEFVCSNIHFKVEFWSWSIVWDIKVVAFMLWIPRCKTTWKPLSLWAIFNHGPSPSTVRSSVQSHCIKRMALHWNEQWTEGRHGLVVLGLMIGRLWVRFPSLLGLLATLSKLLYFDCSCPSNET
jgi:hypothetical protein